MQEQWKDIKGYEGLYKISNMGNVLSIKKNIILKTKKRRGYVAINLYKNKKLKTFNVHRLVAMAFIPNPQNLEQVNHLDCNKDNNKVDNLAWCTANENIAYKYSDKARKEYFFKSLESEYSNNEEILQQIKELKRLIKL